MKLNQYLYMTKVKNLIDSFLFLHTHSLNIMQDANTHKVGQFIKCCTTETRAVLFL